jgi:hypothetical protein
VAVALTAILAIVGFTVAASLALLRFSLALSVHEEPAEADDPLAAQQGRPRIQLLSRLLFSRRQPESIVIDCLLLSIEQAGPGVTAPEGMPFTLQLRTPDTGWFAERVDQLLSTWADESRELLLELREDQGKVRTRIASGDASVQLELSGAAGLSLTS